MTSDKETAIAMFMRVCGATSHNEQENGSIILTAGSGKKIVRHKVTASMLSQVEERIRTHVQPFLNELQPVLLGAKTQPRKYKRDPGKH